MNNLYSWSHLGCAITASLEDFKGPVVLRGPLESGMFPGEGHQRLGNPGLNSGAVVPHHTQKATNLQEILRGLHPGYGRDLVWVCTEALFTDEVSQQLDEDGTITPSAKSSSVFLSSAAFFVSCIL